MRRQKFQKSKSEFMNSIYKNLNVRLICQIFLGSTFLFLISMGCQDDVVNPSEDTITETQRVGFELIQIFSADSILVWVNDEPLTQDEFDSIQLTSEWRKNEPREGDPDGSTFFRSPDATEDGIFTRKELFGYRWLFNAQIVQQNVVLPNNDDALLNGRNIAKYHQVKFNPGKTLYILISPNGEEYIRVSRDANRSTDIPIIPESWKLEERVLENELIIDLPNPTLNIRAENNQDSFQGPVII